MLSKLIKHEWKDTYMVGTVCSIVVVVLTIIGMLLFSLDVWNESASRENEFAMEFTASMIMLYFVMMIYGIAALIMVIRYYFFWRYHKNLFTDQGYLLNTLPVKSSDLIKSKLIVGVIWQYIAGFVVGISIVLLMSTMVIGFGELTVAEFVEGIGEIFIDFQTEVLGDVEFVKALPMAVGYLLIMIASPIFDLLLMYTAVGIGQLSKKHKFLMAVLVLLGFNLAIQTVSSFVSVPMTLLMDGDNILTIYNTVMVSVAVIMVGGSFGLYYLSKYFLEKKLNLE
ncbi:MAG: hypothetical protein J6K37_07020 [Lachnospiraceae bacterium]|nr:hypothetical protein [Lachnospiraceae bacterium]